MRLDPVRVAGLARADLLERTRRPAFLVLLGVGLWAAWIFTPPNDSAYATLRMADARGIYGSAWVGATVAMLTAVFFSLAGFYVVKNAIAGDRISRVGPVLASTPMANVEYVLGKWLSSTALLSALTLVMMVGAALMQVVRGEDPMFRPLALAAPFVWTVLPAMAVVAAIAVWFEAVPVLAGGVGNIAYFFFWAGALLQPSSQFMQSPSVFDPLGIRMLVGEMLRAGRESVPEFAAHPESFSIGINFRTGGWHLQTFAWSGVDWTPARMAERVAWFVLAACIAALAALPFDRFAGERRAVAKRGRAPRPRTGPATGRAEGPAAASVPIHAARVADLAPVTRRFGGFALVRAEWRLLVGGVSPWWWIMLLLIQVPGLFIPLDIAGRFAAVSWIWPVLRWSSLGARERIHGTSALLDASPRPVRRQLPAALMAGIGLGLIAGAAFSLRLLALGRWDAAAGWLCGAIFVPALALALGTLTGGRKTFEIVYVVLWYVGPLNGVALVDFTGGSGGGAAPAFALAAALLVGVAAFARARRVALG